MVGDHPQRDVGPLVDAVPLLGQLGRALEHLPHGVDLVDVVDALQQRGHPLHAHAGVDVARRQVADDVEVHLGPDRAELVLHEDQVPDLEVAVLVRLRPALAAVLGAAVVVDLRARAAGAGHAHVPVVVGQAAALDPVLGHADHVVPELGRLVVVVQDRDPEPALGEAEPAVGLRPGQQLPGERDGLLLEVVAEREVAEHLEERAVPGGLADLLDVRRPHALLAAGGAPERRRLLAEEIRLERLHAGVDQQQRGVVGDQAGRGDHGVPALLEVAKETADDLCRLHHGHPSRRRARLIGRRDFGLIRPRAGPAGSRPATRGRSGFRGYGQTPRDADPSTLPCPRARPGRTQQLQPRGTAVADRWSAAACPPGRVRRAARRHLIAGGLAERVLRRERIEALARAVGSARDPAPPPCGHRPARSACGPACWPCGTRRRRGPRRQRARIRGGSSRGPPNGSPP